MKDQKCPKNCQIVGNFLLITLFLRPWRLSKVILFLHSSNYGVEHDSKYQSACSLNMNRQRNYTGACKGLVKLSLTQESIWPM